MLGERTWAPENELQGRYWTTAYPSTALVPMMVAVDAGRRAEWSTLGVPVVLVRPVGA